MPSSSNADFADAYNNQRFVRSGLGDKQRVIADYTQAIKFKPDYANAYNNWGSAHSDLGNKQGAIAGYQQAATLYLNQGSVLNFL
ncbi:tetratricopeptide repeat protein [Cyanobacteria bacterium FACHB-471]|nr:tetratricopeptide repeat protein [Cyanobacteria bacterium FACHB-471]